MSQLLVNSLSSGCLILVVALSFWLVYAPTRTFYLSHASAITFGAYGAYLLHERLKLSLVPAAAISLVVTGGIFVLLDFLVFRYFRRDSKGWVGLVASIGLYTVLQNMISLTFGDETLLLHGTQVQVGKRIGNAYIVRSQELIVLAALFSLLLTCVLLYRTKMGRGIRAVANNSELAIIFGISPDRVIAFAVGIGCGMAALGGALSAYDMDLNPTMGFPLLLTGVVAMILGGTGSIGGLVLAAMFIATAQNAAAYFFGAQWMDVVTYSILIAFLMWRPLGVRGNILKKTEV